MAEMIVAGAEEMGRGGEAAGESHFHDGQARLARRDAGAARARVEVVARRGTAQIAAEQAFGPAFEYAGDAGEFARRRISRPHSSCPVARQGDQAARPAWAARVAASLVTRTPRIRSASDPTSRYVAARLAWSKCFRFIRIPTGPCRIDLNHYSSVNMFDQQERNHGASPIQPDANTACR